MRLMSCYRTIGHLQSLARCDGRTLTLVLNIHSLLRQIFDNPKNVYGFASMKNDNGFFNGRAPLDVMVQGDLASLYETLKHVEALHAISQ